jgi:hypothetical protein
MDRSTTHHIQLEAASIAHDVGQTFEAAAEFGRVLEDIGAGAYEAATFDAFRDASPEDLHRRASHLRGFALHAVAVATNLATTAGHMEYLAEVRRMASVVGAEDDRLLK